MRRHRPLGDEQPGCDLLVAETLGNQLGDLDFPPGEGSGFAAMRRGDLVIIGFTKREPHCGVPGQACARLKFSSELRLSQARVADALALASNGACGPRSSAPAPAATLAAAPNSWAAGPHGAADQTPRHGRHTPTASNTR